MYRTHAYFLIRIIQITTKMSVVSGCPLGTSNFSKQILGGDVGGEGDRMKSHCFTSVVSNNIC